MIVVTAEIHLASKETINDVLDTFKVIEEKTRQESGCLTYAFSVDISNASILRLNERWESMEALKAHFKEPYMAEFQQKLSTLDIKSMDGKAYGVDKEWAFEDLA